MRINGFEIEADQFVHDDCHQFYIVDSYKGKAAMERHGWPERQWHPIGELPELWAASCPDRFILSADLKRKYASGTATFEGWEIDDGLRGRLEWLDDHPGTPDPAFVGELIDVFEDFLEEKGVHIPNAERDEELPGEARIWGDDYGSLGHDLVRIVYGEWRRQCENSL